MLLQIKILFKKFIISFKLFFIQYFFFIKLLQNKFIFKKFIIFIKLFLSNLKQLYY